MYARRVTLVASTVNTVTMDKDYNRIEVVNEDGAAAVEFAVGGATPTVGGNDQYFLPAAIGGLEVEVESGAVTTVKLISTGTPKVYVRGF